MEPPSGATKHLVATGDYIHLSKREFIELIKLIPFNGITISNSFINDDPESMEDFIREISIKLMAALVENVPAGLSIKGMFDTMSFFRTVDPDKPTTSDNLEDGGGGRHQSILSWLLSK